MAIERATETVQSAVAVVYDGRTGKADGPTPRLFTVDEYYKMAEAGILRPDERVQLIEGTIYVLGRKTPAHASRVNQLNKLLILDERIHAYVSCQGPVRLSHLSEPEPDISLVRRYPDDSRVYMSRHPGVDDLYLAVEVADNTLSFDLGEKANMYVKYGVPELWVLDLLGNHVVVHRQPTPSGYASIESLTRGAAIVPLAFPDITFTVDRILG